MTNAMVALLSSNISPRCPHNMNFGPLALLHGSQVVSVSQISRRWTDAPSVQRREIWLTLTIWLPCSNAAKTQNRLKFARVPQTNETISAASGPKFTILWGHLGEILLLNSFFPIVDTCLSCEDIAGQSCAMVSRRRFLATFLGPAFAASRAAAHFRPAF